MNIHILSDCGCLGYAVQELRHFLNEYTTAEVLLSDVPGEKTAILRVDNALEEHRYSIQGDGAVLRITGGNPSAVLCGVYEALSDAGIFFEATGYSVPRQFNLDAFFRTSKEVHPKCRLRGIRQHINFPMDISSYPLSEAKEYIRSLARMRFNAISFHSYGGQWHSVAPGQPDSYAGHFFYGQHHPVPADPLTASRINNRNTYCIPETEAIYHDESARSEYAQYWLKEVMNTAKEAGMTLTMSVEITGDDEEAVAKMLHELCRTYPQIDILELISEECGGFRSIAGLSRENVVEYITDLFGKDILDADGNLPGLGDTLPGQLGASAVSLKRVLRAVESRQTWLAGLEKVPTLRAGLYVTCANTLKILWPILRKLLPGEFTRSLLPAHGALAVADNIEQIGMTAEDWQNTMFYSWAEFDGNMYIQQLSTDGIEKLAEMSDAESIYGFCINHWRTAENNIAISYMAETSVAPIKTEEYYRNYAEKLEIADTEGFSAACRKLAWLDTYNRDNLFNIGFCFVGCWFRKGTVVPPRCYPEKAIQTYDELTEDFRALLLSCGTKEAIALIRLLINRCRTSAMHIHSMLTLDGIKKLYDYSKPQEITRENLEKIQELIAESRAYANDFIHLYGEMLPDRGGEGLVVSYCETVPVFIDAVASHFVNDIDVSLTDTYDAPPPPDAESK